MSVKKAVIIGSLAVVLIILVGVYFLDQSNSKNRQRNSDSFAQEAESSKVFLNNEFRDKGTDANTYLKSLAPMVVYSDKRTGEFVGLTSTGKEVVLNTPKIDFFNTTSVVFDKPSDSIFYIDGRYDDAYKREIGTMYKINIADKNTRTLVDSVFGEIVYVDKNALAVDEYGVAGEAIIQLYDVNTGKPLQQQSYVKSDRYQTEYRIVMDDTVFQMVFDNYGGMKSKIVLKSDGLHKQYFPVSSDSLKVHFNKVGTLNREYLSSNNISAAEYLRSVYSDQKNTSQYFTTVTGDIWPKGNKGHGLILFPAKPVKIGDYYDTYYTMGNFYEISTGKYAQTIGDGLVIFDISDMSVKLTMKREEIDSLLMKKKLIAPAINHIEQAGTPASCGDLIGSSFKYPRVLENRNNSWFAYCLR